jgi:hypothetical protein
LNNGSILQPRWLDYRDVLGTKGLVDNDKWAMLLEINGRASSGKRTRNINIRHFLVLKHIAAGEVKVEYRYTGDMTADCFTTPLQGSIFKRMRDAIMNVNPVAPSPLMDSDCWNLLNNGMSYMHCRTPTARTIRTSR